MQFERFHLAIGYFSSGIVPSIDGLHQPYIRGMLFRGDREAASNPDGGLSQFPCRGQFSPISDRKWRQIAFQVTVDTVRLEPRASGAGKNLH
jgi:hypothetical protein